MSIRPQPLLNVTDVEASSDWYQQLLGLTSAHGGPEYERLEDEGRLVLQLHHFDADHHHGPLGDPDHRPYGNGVAVWFELDDLDGAVERAQAMGATVVRDLHVNPNAHHRELWLHDLDGYLVVLASPDGDVASTGEGAG